MANVLTDLAADIYKSADVIGRELVGFIPACTINSDSSEQAAKGDTVRSHFTHSATVGDQTPAMTIPEGTDQTVDSKTLTLDKSRGVQIPWTGEDIKHVNNGSGFETVYGDQVLQAMRALVNEIEADLAQAAYQSASRAVGTAGTTPFGSNFNDVAKVRQVLVDNGMPSNDGRASLILNSAAGTNLRNLAQLQKANEAGGDQMLRQGVLLDLQGLALRESAQVKTHTKGSASGRLANSASLAIGDTSIAFDTGSGAFNAGDVVTFNGDANNYVVKADASATPLVINGPGLRTAVADNSAITVGNNFTANVAMHQAALELAMRAPAVPPGGDAASERLVVQDDHSGLIFDIAVYKGFQKMMINVSATWGKKAWKDEYIAILMG